VKVVIYNTFKTYLPVVTVFRVNSNQFRFVRWVGRIIDEIRIFYLLGPVARPVAVCVKTNGITPGTRQRAENFLIVGIN